MPKAIQSFKGRMGNIGELRKRSTMPGCRETGCIAKSFRILQVVSVGVCVSHVRVASKGIKPRKKNIRFDLVQFFYMVACSWVLSFYVLVHLPGNDVNMVS